jgi:hypothetical protein
MDGFNPIPPIRPIIPDITRVQPLPRVQRDEQRQPAPDDERPPEQDGDLDEEQYDDAWQEEHLPAVDVHVPASEERYAAEQYAAEEAAEQVAAPTPPITNRRGTGDPSASPEDGPGPHIDITA